MDAITEAAASLRADPTYELMTPAERLDEAEALLRSLGHPEPDDALALALVLESVANAPADQSGQVVADQAGEGCREERVNCRAAVSATGRCLDCGAYRGPPSAAAVAMATPQASEKPPQAVEPSKAPSPLVTAPKAPTAGKSAANLPTGGRISFLYRVKAATGMTEPQLAELLGISRATVQAYVSGRLPTLATPQQAADLREAMARQADAIRELAAEI